MNEVHPNTYVISDGSIFTISENGETVMYGAKKWKKGPHVFQFGSKDRALAIITIIESTL